MYNSEGPCLRQGKEKEFFTAMNCLATCGGMNIEFFHQITANSNEYARKNANPNTSHFDGSPWKNINLKEMIHFFGMVLKMSIDDHKLGGY